MTQKQFLDLVISIVEVRGASWAKTPVEQYAATNERLYAFTERTRCLYTDTATISLVAHTGVYSLFSGFNVPLLSLDQFIVNGEVLQAAYLADLRAISETYASDEEVQPTHWALIPGTTAGQDSVRVFPVPSAGIATCKASGDMGHPQLKTDGTDAATEISIPRDYQHTAAIFCAVGFLYPSAGAGTDVQLMANIDASAARAMDELQYRASRMLNETPTRGTVRGSNRSRTVSLT